MRNQTILLSILASLTASGCQQLECAEGTIERDGRCEASSGPIGSAMCGPFTSLIGDRCVPDFPPTVCDDPASAELDPETGVTTCKGGGIPPCGTPLGCSKPTGASKQTFCGTLYDFETNVRLGDPVGTPGAQCDPAAPTATGPCALTMIAYDALVFAANPQTATPLNVGEVFLDNCGRFRLTEVETNGTGPFIGLGVDDASGLGPTGTTVTAAIAVPKQGMTAANNLEHWIVTPATIGKWQQMGAPPLSGGLYAPIFRAHKAGNPGMATDAQAGVTITRNGNTIPNNDTYFSDTDPLSRAMISTGATATGANGTALVTGAVAADGLVFNGQGGLGAGCRWDPHAGASLPGIVFIQVFRKLDILGQTCND